MSTTTLIHRIIIGFACFTTMGILLHDTKFDKAVYLALPAATVVVGLNAHALDTFDNAHTHVERASLSHAFSGMPRLQPRDDTKKYLLQKVLSRNSDFFGGSRILWPSV